MVDYYCKKCRKRYTEDHIDRGPSGMPLCPIMHPVSRRLRTIRDDSDVVYYEM